MGAVIGRNIATKTQPPPRPVDDEPPRQVRRHIMAGAEVPLTLDKDRPLEHVLRDHAVATWGELRGVFELDSAKAETVLAAAMGRMLLAVRDDTAKLNKRIKALEHEGSKILGALKQATIRTANNSDPHMDNRRRCKVCNQPFSEHAEKCCVGLAIKRGREAGLTVGTEGE